MTKILHKRGSGEPDAESLDVGEIALDTSAGAAYTKLSNGTVVEIGGGGGGIEEAPKTGKMYARKDEAWEEFATANIDDINADINELREDFENHDHALDDLSDVNAGSPARDNLLIFNGSQWVSDEWAFIDTALRFKGGISPTAQAPANPEGGDLYVFDSDGTISASWGAIAGEQVEPGKFVGYAADTHNRWYLLGNMADIGVVNVSPGIGIDVDDSKPSEPVVSVDRDEVDKWYAAKGDIVWKQNGDDIYYNDGNVGIGTDSPSGVPGTLLELSKSGSTRLNISASDSSYSAVDFSDTSDDGAGRLEYYHIIDAMRFWTNNEKRMRIDSQGRVGIGTTPTESTKLKVSLKSASEVIRFDNETSGRFFAIGLEDNQDAYIWSSNNNTTGSLRFMNGPGSGTERMRIDANGRVGIGGQPSRSTKEIEDGAEATLRNWDSKDKKPTKAELVKRLVERNIGGGDAKLQVAGDGYFSGDVYATRYLRENIGGIIFANPADSQVNVHIRPAKADGTASNGVMDIGAPNLKFKDAHFSGTVNAGEFASRGPFYREGQSGLTFTTTAVRPVDGTGEHLGTDGSLDIGNSNYRFKDAHFSGTIYGKVDDVADHIKKIPPTQIANWDAGTGGGGGGATTDGRISDDQIVHWDQAYSWGNHASAGYQPAGNYLTPSSLNGYATESWVQGQGYLTSASLNGYATESWVTSNYQPAGNYLTSSSLSGYATESWVTSGYQPKGSYANAGDSYTKVESDGNYEPKFTKNNAFNKSFGTTSGTVSQGNHTHSQYLTSSSLSGYATESWVTAGYQPKGSYAPTTHTHPYVPLSGNSTIDGTLTCTGDVIAYSDERLKDNVETLDGSKVFEMRGVSYTRDGKESSGVIAQELQKVAPELVHDEGEYLGVAYGNLVGYLIGAVKELKAGVEALKRG